MNYAKKWIDSGHLLENNGVITLSQKGILMTDRIVTDLFWVD